MGNQLRNNEKSQHQGDAILEEELLQPKRGRKRRANTDSGAPVSFKWPWEWDACLDRYLADCKETEHHHIQKTKVIMQVLKDFLAQKGYRPSSKDS